MITALQKIYTRNKLIVNLLKNFIESLFVNCSCKNVFSF